MKRSESVKEICAALAKAQASMGNAIKNTKNAFFKNRYADFTALVEVIREPFASNALFFTQEVTSTDKTVSVITTIWHATGEWLEFDALVMPIGANTAQGIGSATTYAKRYSLGAAAGIATSEDDDGNLASGIPVQKQEKCELIDNNQIHQLDAMLEETTEEFRRNFINLLAKKYGKGSLELIKLADYPNIVAHINNFKAAVKNETA